MRRARIVFGIFVGGNVLGVALVRPWLLGGLCIMKMGGPVIPFFVFPLIGFTLLVWFLLVLLLRHLRRKYRALFVRSAGVFVPSNSERRLRAEQLSFPQDGLLRWLARLGILIVTFELVWFVATLVIIDRSLDSDGTDYGDRICYPERFKQRTLRIDEDHP